MTEENGNGMVMPVSPMYGGNVGNDVTVNLYGYNFGYGSESILVAEMSRN